MTFFNLGEYSRDKEKSAKTIQDEDQSRDDEMEITQNKDQEREMTSIEDEDQDSGGDPLGDRAGIEAGRDFAASAERCHAVARHEAREGDRAGRRRSRYRPPHGRDISDHQTGRHDHSQCPRAARFGYSHRDGR